MIAKIYRYRIAAGKWDDFLTLQKRADEIYRRHVVYDVQFVRNLMDPQRITEIHTYPSREMTNKANDLHKVEPELNRLYGQFLALLETPEIDITEKVGDVFKI